MTIVYSIACILSFIAMMYGVFAGSIGLVIAALFVFVYCLGAVSIKMDTTSYPR